jgi:phospholipid/cholesterol/gamma-HCH transport system ATP-binding protein
MEPDKVIVVEGLTKSFGPRVVLQDIALGVRKAETVVILGASGCGKSTLLRCLMGAEQPDTGSISILGKNIAGIPESELDKIRLRFGILFQTGALYNSMTVGENVALPLVEHTNLSRNIIDIMVKMKLELVGLRDFESLLPSQISGGMKKRVALARAIALDPEILFYDEPTAGLDPIVASVIDTLIMDLSKKLNVTSVVVTHSMESAFKIGDRIIVLYEGKIIQQGTPDQIKHSDNAFVKQFITGSPDGPIPLRRSSKDFAEDLIGG